MHKWQLVAVGVARDGSPVSERSPKDKDIYFKDSRSCAHRRKKLTLLAEGTVLEKLNAAYHVPFPDVFCSETIFSASAFRPCCTPGNHNLKQQLLRRTTFPLEGSVL